MEIKKLEKDYGEIKYTDITGHLNVADKGVYRACSLEKAPLWLRGILHYNTYSNQDYLNVLVDSKISDY